MKKTQGPYLPNLSVEERKRALLRNFEYRWTSHNDKEVFVSPTGEKLTLDDAYAWLESNGVSIDKSYQDNMETYLSRYGFIRGTHTNGKRTTFRPDGQTCTQVDALRFIDTKRKFKSIDDKSDNNKVKRKPEAMEDWAKERRPNQSFQDWLLEKAGYV